MIEYLIGGFVIGIFAGIAILNTWNYFWDTHGERPFSALEAENIEALDTVKQLASDLHASEADNLRFIKANAEVANLNADLQDENMLLREALYKIANDHNRPSIDGDPFFYSEYAEMTAEAALASDDLSKLTTQQKPTEEAMLHANPSCGMDGCLWQEDSNSA